MLCSALAPEQTTSARERALSPRARAAALIAGSGVAMLLLFLLVKGTLNDDAYITLAYAKNLALDFHWGVIPQEVSNTATSPLNVVLLGLLTAATRIFGEADPIVALGIVSVATAMVTAWAWLRVVRALDLPLVAAVVGTALALSNPFVLSAIGLEVLLIPAVLTALLAMALENRPGWFGVVAGLALLTRIDLVVFVIAIAAATPAVRQRWRRALAGLAIAAGPWFAFSWVFLGSALPDTVVIKTAQRGLFDPFGFVSGPVLYFTRHWNATMVAFLPAVLGLFALVAWLAVRFGVRWRAEERLPRNAGIVAALAAGGVVYYAGLSVLRVPPYHWYYVPPLIALSAFLVIAGATWLRVARTNARLRPAIPIAVLALAGLLALGNLARDVKQGVPWDAPVYTTNYADAETYERAALALRERVGDDAVQSAGEIGALAYFCECAIVDVFSDRGQAVELINERIEATGAVRGLFYKLNFLFLDRDQKPRPVRYQLRYTHGPSPGGRDVYPVWSAWIGAGRLSLHPAPNP